MIHNPYSMHNSMVVPVNRVAVMRSLQSDLIARWAVDETDRRCEQAWKEYIQRAAAKARKFGWLTR